MIDCLKHLLQHPVCGLEVVAFSLLLEQLHQVGPLHTWRLPARKQVPQDILNSNGNRIKQQVGPFLPCHLPDYNFLKIVMSYLEERNIR
jgi:hypothetical protein